MSNPWYDNSDVGGRFVAGTTARGTAVDAKFDAVEAGFDGVEAAMDALETSLSGVAATATAAAATATTQAGIATTQASTATTQASAASASASAAATSAATASAKADESLTAATAAFGHATTASTAADLAEDWAVKMDGPVAGGEYSAKYWADQAGDIVSAGAPVTSVAGRLGDIVLSTADVSGLGTAATKDVGTSGDTIAQPNGAITWSSKQTFGAALIEKHNAVAASAIDLALGNFFSKTISGATTFTVSNVPASGSVASFILELTNGGSATVTWWAGVKWAGGTAPTLTAAGRDVLGFFTRDGGTTWTGLLLAKDAK